MSTTKARKALDENTKLFINSQKDPVMWNLHVALREITKAIDELDRKIVHVSNQIR